MLEWNAAQAEVIASPADARLVVDAGPGTGKTATAAGRIAALVAQGVPPQTLWTISFSRAAVGEMRARLARLGGSQALGRVTTLDSLAWYLRSDQGEDGAVLEGHDRAIEETLTSLRAGDAAILQRIAAIRHFTIDEAQDLVGARASLVVELIAALPPLCGVTIFTDEAQAIYGFSASALTSSFTADTIARHVLDEPDTSFRLRELTEIHRTGDHRLLGLFQAARRRALQQVPNPVVKLKRMRRSIAWCAHGRLVSKPDAQTLILYRSRAEVLAAAQQRSERGQPYRLRLSGLPVMLQPWIAIVLADFKATTLPRWQFEDLWGERIGGDPDPAWAILAQVSGDPDADRIALKKLLAIFGTSHPPSELCLFDIGDPVGPVIGTIHASKGREMEHVQLMLPQDRIGRDDPDGEARVLFVGATRAKHRLDIGKGLRQGAKRLANGRVFIPLGTATGKIELGRPGDFDWRSDTDFTVLKAGERLDLVWVDGALQIGRDGVTLGRATPLLMADLRDLRARLAGSIDYRGWTARLRGLTVLGLYTIASDDGLHLAPAVSGLVACEFLPA
jgi:hypothetical protein